MGVALNPMTGVLQEEGDFTQRHREDYVMMEGGSWSDAATGQGMQRIIGNHLKLETVKETFLLKACRRKPVLPKP